MSLLGFGTAGYHLRPGGIVSMNSHALRLQFGLFMLLMLFVSGCATRIKAQDGLNLKSKRLLITPFQCELPDVGTMIADSIAAELVGASMSVIYRDTLTLSMPQIHQGDVTKSVVTGIDSLEPDQAKSLCDYLMTGIVTVAPFAGASTFINPQFGISGSSAGVAPTAVTAKVVNVHTNEVVMSIVHFPSRTDPPNLTGVLIAKRIKKKFGL